MINKIRILIRESLRNMLEAEPTIHSDQRVEDRINKLHVPEDKKTEIDYKLGLLNKINFRPIAKKTNSDLFAVHISTFKVPQQDLPHTTYDDYEKKFYYVYYDKRNNPSIGDQIWAIVSKENNIVTIMLRKSSQGTDINYIKRKTGADMVIKDLTKLLPQNLK